MQRAIFPDRSIVRSFPARSWNRTLTVFGSLHPSRKPGKRETALVIDLFAGGLDDLRVDELEILAQVVDHRYPLRYADLRRGERRSVETRREGEAYGIDERIELFVKRDHRPRFLPEHRVAEEYDGRFLHVNLMPPRRLSVQFFTRCPEPVAA